MRVHVLGIAAMLALGAPIQSAHAYTECTSSVSQIFSGDEGNVWVVFTNGGAVAIPPTDLDQGKTMSMAMAALVAGRTVTARYAANGVACNTTRFDLTGFWLN
jgi:hypothetical protein